MRFSIITVLLIVVALNLVRADAQTTQPIRTSLEEIIAGKFPSASDKFGTGGVLVMVENLTVNYPQYVAEDGDWNIIVSDSITKGFITELIPRDQAASSYCPSCSGNLTIPSAGLRITEIGTPYCDTLSPLQTPCGGVSNSNARCKVGHSQVLTCWEIHPVVNWFPYTPIPEFPSTAIVVLAVLVLGTLMLKKHYPLRQFQTEDI